MWLLLRYIVGLTAYFAMVRWGRVAYWWLVGNRGIEFFYDPYISYSLAPY